MLLGIQPKQPSEKLDYDVTFEEWLTDDDTVQTATAVLDTTGELVIEDILVLSPTVKVWLSGGVNGITYKVTVKAITAQGRIKEAEFKIRVRDC